MPLTSRCCPRRADGTHSWRPSPIPTRTMASQMDPTKRMKSRRTRPSTPTRNSAPLRSAPFLARHGRRSGRELTTGRATFDNRTTRESVVNEKTSTPLWTFVNWLRCVTTVRRTSMPQDEPISQSQAEQMYLRFVGHLLASEAVHGGPLPPWPGAVGVSREDSVTAFLRHNPACEKFRGHLVSMFASLEPLQFNPEKWSRLQ